MLSSGLDEFVPSGAICSAMKAKEEGSAAAALWLKWLESRELRQAGFFEN
jgi:hypothetical protein